MADDGPMIAMDPQSAAARPYIAVIVEEGMGWLDQADKIASVAGALVALIALLLTVMDSRRKNGDVSPITNDESLPRAAISAASLLLRVSVAVLVLPLVVSRFVAWIAESAGSPRPPGWVIAFVAYCFGLGVLAIFVFMTETGDDILHDWSDHSWAWPLLVAIYGTSIFIIPVGLPALVGWIVIAAGGSLGAGWRVLIGALIELPVLYAFGGTLLAVDDKRGGYGR